MSGYAHIIKIALSILIIIFMISITWTIKTYITDSSSIITLIVISDIIISIILLVWIWMHINPIYLLITIIICAVSFTLAATFIAREKCDITNNANNLYSNLLIILYIIAIALYKAMDALFLKYTTNAEFKCQLGKFDEANEAGMIANRYVCKRYYVPMSILYVVLGIANLVKNNTLTGLTILTELYWLIGLFLTIILGGDITGNRIGGYYKPHCTKFFNIKVK